MLNQKTNGGGQEVVFALFNRISPSSLLAWSDCESRALYRATRQPGERGEERPRRIHAQAAYGVGVHAIVAGERWEEPIHEIEWTDKIPNFRSLKFHVERDGAAAREKLEREGTIIFREKKVQHPTMPVMGTLDVVTATDNGRLPPTWIVWEIKTGLSAQNPRKHIYQLGTYAWLLSLQAAAEQMVVGDIRVGVLSQDVGGEPKIYIDTDGIAIPMARHLVERVDRIRRRQDSACSNPSSMLCASRCGNKYCYFHPSHY